MLPLDEHFTSEGDIVPLVTLSRGKQHTQKNRTKKRIQRSRVDGWTPTSCSALRSTKQNYRSSVTHHAPHTAYLPLGGLCSSWEAMPMPKRPHGDRMSFVRKPVSLHAIPSSPPSSRTTASPAPADAPLRNTHSSHRTGRSTSGAS